jgi:hypothetical protein
MTPPVAVVMAMMMSVPGRPVVGVTMFVPVVTNGITHRRSDDERHGRVILMCLRCIRQAQTQSYDTDADPLHFPSDHFCLLSISGRVRMG